jgi:hypothetical protein
MSRPSTLTKAIELLITAVDLLNHHQGEIESDAKELETLRKLKPHLVIISKTINLSELTPDGQIPASAGDIINTAIQKEAKKRVRHIKNIVKADEPTSDQ